MDSIEHWLEKGNSRNKTIQRMRHCNESNCTIKLSITRRCSKSCAWFCTSKIVSLLCRRSDVALRLVRRERVVVVVVVVSLIELWLDRRKCIKPRRSAKHDLSRDWSNDSNLTNQWNNMNTSIDTFSLRNREYGRTW